MIRAPAIDQLTREIRAPTYCLGDNNMISENRRTHIRIYTSDGKLVMAMDADVDGNKLAKDVFDMVNKPTNNVRYPIF